MTLATQGSTMVYTQNQRPEKPSKSLPVPTKKNVRVMTKEERKEFDAKLERMETLQAKIDHHRGLANAAQERANSIHQQRVEIQGQRQEIQKDIEACDDTIKQAQERNAKREAMRAMMNKANSQPQPTQRRGT